MTQLLKDKITVPDGVLVRELAGESVLLNLNSESYFGLDEVGTRMWAALTTTPTVAAACASMLSEYEVEPERLHADVHNFIQKLAELGLLHVHAE